MNNNKITYNPIGIIYTPFKNIEGTPIQPSGAKNINGVIELNEKYAAGLKDLSGFSHIILIYHFHLIKEFSLEVIPFLDETSRGIFATRAPKRPNPIGLSIVRLLKIEGSKLFVENIDVVDGTPLLDIKPYIKEFDNQVKSKRGWITNSAYKSNITKSDARFK